MKLPIQRPRSEQSERRPSVGQESLDDMFFNWSPFTGFELARPLRRMVDRMDQWLPRVDVSETESELKVAVDVPNVDPKDLSVTAEDERLVISGKTDEETETKDENYHHVERYHGDFRRVIDLPRGADVDAISAEAKHGSLYVTIPKKAEAKGKAIDVEVKA